MSDTPKKAVEGKVSVPRAEQVKNIQASLVRKVRAAKKDADPIALSASETSVFTQTEYAGFKDAIQQALDDLREFPVKVNLSFSVRNGKTVERVNEILTNGAALGVEDVIVEVEGAAKAVLSPEDQAAAFFMGDGDENALPTVSTKRADAPPDDIIGSDMVDTGPQSLSETPGAMKPVEAPKEGADAVAGRILKEKQTKTGKFAPVKVEPPKKGILGKMKFW